MGKAYIIAEAGVNHNGDLSRALKMVDVAAEAGACAIKFQTFIAEKGISRKTKKADYQDNACASSETMLDIVKKLELDKEAHLQIQKRCQEKQIDFLSTPFDLESIDLLQEIGLKVFKIPSGEITNLPHLRKLGSLGVEIVLSTGMSEIFEIRKAIEILVDSGTNIKDITVLQCNTQYPTPFEDVNLLAMNTIAKELHVKVGLSDHSLGIEVPIAACALGATVIEKHFTLDRNLEGPDHQASIEPSQLVQMVASIRNIEKALGDGVKRITASEKQNRNLVRKSIVAMKDIQKGEILSPDNLAIKRPATGISPLDWDQVVGRKARKDFNEDDFIEL